ncbi:brain tumor protein [Caerostris darwini]|uniref:Brain tumor protein n=1 Tax=Caerostris darwini TaxID=1538125 RepID=A0AAV4W3T7_9ARAC|nr:brain tumor protein [Caerostris darwini]
MASQDEIFADFSRDSLDKCLRCKSEIPPLRILDCLHIFCEKCLYLQTNISDSIYCPECQQKTVLNGKGISGLPLHFITSDGDDLKKTKQTRFICAYCKKEVPDATRWRKCDALLCHGCLESHKKILFDGENSTPNKGILCDFHPNEKLLFFCNTCHSLICNTCIIKDHKKPEHFYEKTVDVEQKQRKLLNEIIVDSQEQMKFCNELTSVLDTQLCDMYELRDIAECNIEEEYRSFKDILKSRKEHMLEELDVMHTSHGLGVVDTYRNVEKATDNIEKACNFAKKLLVYGSTLDVINLTDIVRKQLSFLNDCVPNYDVLDSIIFETNKEMFEENTKETFGTLKAIASPIEKDVLLRKNSSKYSNGSFSENNLSETSTDLLEPSDRKNNSDDLQKLDNFDLMSDTSKKSICQNSSDGLSSYSDLEIMFETDSDTDSSDVWIDIEGGSPVHIYRSGNVTPTMQFAINNHHPAMNDTFSYLYRYPTPMQTGNQFIPLNTRPFLANGYPVLGRNFIEDTSWGIHAHQDNFATREFAATNLPQCLYSSFPIPRRGFYLQLKIMFMKMKFGKKGDLEGEFDSPTGFCLGLDDEIIVADSNNHRIQVFDRSGNFQYYFGVPGKSDGRLWFPRKITVIEGSGDLAVVDRGRATRMQIFTRDGEFLKAIPLHYIAIVSALASTGKNNVVVVDSLYKRVFIFSLVGDIVHSFDISQHMIEPSDIAVHCNQFYICDFKGHCVVVFSDSGHFLRKIGCENTTFPNGVDISKEGHVLISDSHGNYFHVVSFSKEGYYLNEFEYPYTKFSRCTGLKVTSENNVVTLARSNNQVLMLSPFLDIDNF